MSDDMTKDEALEMVDWMIEHTSHHSSRHPNHKRQLRTHITALHARIVELEVKKQFLENEWQSSVDAAKHVLSRNDQLITQLRALTTECGACGGRGKVKPHFCDEQHSNEPDKCPDCQGTGRQRRWVVPGWFAEMISTEDYYFVEDDKICISKDSGCVYIKLTKLPTGEWEIQKTTP